MTQVEQARVIEFAIVAVVLLVGVVGYRIWLQLFFGTILVPSGKMGIVTRKFALTGANRTLPDGAIVALKGEAGIQADTLAPGVHFGYWLWQYDVRMEDFTVVPQNKIGIVEARDGTPLAGGRVLADYVDCDSFQDARKFLTNGGQRGPQIAVIPPGTYRINTGLFTVKQADVTEVGDNTVGIVTTKEGAPLQTGDIAGGEVSGHNSFQDGGAFVRNGGKKGLQEQVILAGRYFLNPLFCTVEVQPMTQVPIANVGVVISYVGAPGVDQTGDAFKHGNLVLKGQKGVWLEPLDPGKYPINPYTHKVELVPTQNVVLNWATGKTEAHQLDKNLSTITVRSSDGFKFNLDVSQIIHIPRNEAPKVIARFGNMQNLVTQVLEPTIGNYFRNAAQKSDVIDFLKSRSQRQDDARTQISHALEDYNVNAVDTLIGDITPPDALMDTLTQRKLAEQMKVTYETQQVAEVTRKELAQAKAMADTQPSVVTAERQVAIKEFEAQAQVKQAEGAANAKKIEADGEAVRIAAVGEAQAKATLAVGNAEAEVTQNKIKSMEAGNYAAVAVAEKLAGSGLKLVPDTLITGGSDGNSLGMALLASMLRNSNAAPANGHAVVIDKQ